MKHTLTVLGLLALTTTTAQAGGFERSNMPLGFMFEHGSYAELSFGTVKPSVKGVVMHPLFGALPSGNVTKGFDMLGVAFKMDVNEKMSIGFMIDPTFGADVAYPATALYPIAGTTATLNGDTAALIGRYKINDAMSVHAGLRSVGVGGNVSIVSGGAPVYAAQYETDRDLGFLVGAAYEKPEIALRVALTYASETEHDLSTNVFGMPVGVETVELPKSLTLDFQSGIAANTLVFGSVRWVDWTSTRLNSIGYPVPLQPLIGYDDDTITYTVGLGRKFTDNWSGAVTVSYEESQGGIASNLSPTDGYLSIGFGGTYTQGNMKISAGARLVDVGDATALGGLSEFTGNSAVAVGMKVGFSF